MTQPSGDDLKLLRIQRAIAVVLRDEDRFETAGQPDRSAGPLVAFAGCAAGNLAAVRADVDDALAARILALAAAEPPWDAPRRLPGCIAPIIGLLGLDLALEAVPFGPAYSLPNASRFPCDARMVCSETPDGDRLLAKLAANGVPPALMQAGFVDVSHFWPPWCAAQVGEDIAALAFTVRARKAAAEVGVYTFPGFRGQGLAAAVTAGWSALPPLAERALFYSTQWTNTSSLRVAGRLGLRQIGTTLSLG